MLVVSQLSDSPPNSDCLDPDKHQPDCERNRNDTVASNFKRIQKIHPTKSRVTKVRKATVIMKTIMPKVEEQVFPLFIESMIIRKSR
jgi:hypothetical protein